MSPVSKTRAPHFPVHNPNIYNPFLPPLSTIAHELSIRSHFSRLLIFNPRLKNLLSLSLSLSLAFSRLLLPPNRNPRIPSHSLPLTLLVSILISRGWRTMRPATFHPRVSSTLLSFLSSFLFVSKTIPFGVSPLLPHHLTSNSFSFFHRRPSHVVLRERENVSLLRFCFANLNLLFVSLKIILAKKKIQLLQDSSYRLKK